MSNYSQTTFFTPKDSLPPTNPAKTIFGAAYDVEFGNISAAISSKADAISVISSILGTANEIAVSTTAGVSTLSFSPNIVIPAPASGTALSVNGFAGAFTQQITGAAGSGVSDGLLVISGTNTSDSALQVQNKAQSAVFFNLKGDGSGNLGPSATAGLTWTSSGNVTINAPSSGVALTLNNTATNFGLMVQGGTGSQIAIQTFGSGQAVQSAFQYFSDNNLYIDAPFTGTPSGGGINFRAGIGAPTTRLAISGVGAVTIAAPTSGVPLTVNGTNGANVFSLGSTVASSTLIAGYQNVLSGAWSLSSQSTDGLAIGSDGSASLQLFTNSSTRFTLSSAGGLFGVGATGGDQGLGTVNALGLFVNGGQLFFGVPTSASTTAAVTDVGKMINTGTNLAINTGIFSQGHILSVYNNSASAITINGTIATMRLAGTATTGNRTLAPRGLATLWFESGAEVIVSGPGVS